MDVEKIEVFGLEVREVATYQHPTRCPNGPLAEKPELTALDPILGKPIATAVLIATDGNPMPNCLQMRFWGGETVRISHDESVPLSVRIERRLPSAA